MIFLNKLKQLSVAYIKAYKANFVVITDLFPLGVLQ